MSEQRILPYKVETRAKCIELLFDRFVQQPINVEIHVFLNTAMYSYRINALFSCEEYDRRDVFNHYHQTIHLFFSVSNIHKIFS